MTTYWIDHVRKNIDIDFSTEPYITTTYWIDDWWEEKEVAKRGIRRTDKTTLSATLRARSAGEETVDSIDATPQEASTDEIEQPQQPTTQRTSPDREDAMDSVDAAPRESRCSTWQPSPCAASDADAF